MFKKIISLMLVACMVLALGVTVSAADQGSVYLKVTDGKNAGEIYVIVAIKDNPVGVDEDESGAMEEAETVGMTAFEVAVSYNTEKFELSALKKLGKDEGAYTVNKSTGKSVWVCAGGLYTVNDDGIAEGVAEYDLTQYTFKVKTDAITEEDYGQSFEFKFADVSNATGADVDFTPVTYTIEDTREPIAGLTATPVEGLKYTGEAFAAEDLVTLNTVEGDVVEYTTVPAEVKNAGTYKVTATVKRAGCKATEASADVVIGKKDIEVVMADKDMTYGDALPEFTHDAPAGVEITPTVEANPNAGTVAITATANDTTGNYNVTVKAGTLTVAKKAITVTMADASMTYGDALPEFTHDAPNGVTITPTVAEKPNAGTVAITATAESANYDVTVVNGTLTVAKKAITITAQDEFQVQGRGEIAEYKAAKVEGLVEGDEITNIVVGFKGTYADVEGDYAVEVKSYDENANYEVTKVDGVYSIKTAIPVNVTFGENKKTYGDADDAEILVSGDTDKVIITRVKGLGLEDAATYTDAYEVTLVAAEDPSGLPYALTVENNVFVIEPKAATITVENAEKKYGAEDPAFTFVAEGFLEGEAPAEVEFSRAEGETAGEYAITATYADPNYVITVVDGALTISKYALTITAPTVKVSLGKEVPALEAEIEGAVDEDVIVATVAVYNGEEVVAEVDTSAEAVYTTKATSDANTDKYDVTYVDGTLTVKKASNRPSGGGSVVKPATKPEDKEEVKDDETDKPVASANIALKENAKEVKFIEGFEDKTFRPDTNATRNDVVAALTALFDITDIKNAPTFEDTDDAAIKALAAAGVINGYEDGTFKGYNDVTRAEFVKLVAAALKLEAVEGATADFSDIEGHWAAEWIKTFVGKGYIVGYPDGTFRPDDKITRAEMVVVITRVVGTVDAEAAVNFADIDDTHWAYDYIMKAAK